MSQQLPSNKNTSEEVDLIVFFNLIGKAFRKILDFFALIFTTVFNAIIHILAHLYKQAKWYVIVFVVAIIFGYFLDKNNDKIYGANMFIKTNFNSGRQVYENIMQLNELAAIDKDYKKLASLLEVTEEEASFFKGFYIQPDIDENQTITMFSEYKSNLDSLSLIEANYIDYKSSLNKTNFPNHHIAIAALNKEIFEKLNDNFPNLISENPFLNKMLEVEQDNFIKEEKTLRNQIKKNDSITNLYLNIRTQESSKKATPGSGTNLYMGNAQANELLVDESILINKRLIHEKRIREVQVEKVEKENVISVISAFPKTGYDIQVWQEKNIYKLPLIAISFLIIVFIILGFGKFLKSREQINKI